MHYYIQSCEKYWIRVDYYRHSRTHHLKVLDKEPLHSVHVFVKSKCRAVSMPAIYAQLYMYIQCIHTRRRVWHRTHYCPFAKIMHIYKHTDQEISTELRYTSRQHRALCWVGGMHICWPLLSCLSLHIVAHVWAFRCSRACIWVNVYVDREHIESTRRAWLIVTSHAKVFYK